MPLLKGKENIGHNVREMEAHGHPKKQAVAAALHTALDETEYQREFEKQKGYPTAFKEPPKPPSNESSKTSRGGFPSDPGRGSFHRSEGGGLRRGGDSEEEEFNSTKKRQAQNLGALVSHDEAYAKPVTDMTVADINAKNEKLWYNVGPAPTEAAAPALAGTKVGHNVPVYTGAGIGDEGATPKTGAEAYQMGHPKEAAETAERNRKALEQAGKKLAKTHKKADDEVSPTQSAPPDPRSNNLLGEVAVAGEHDSTSEERTERKNANPEKYPQANKNMIGTKAGQHERNKKAEEVRNMRSGFKKGTTAQAEDDLAMNTESMPPEGQADERVIPSLSSAKKTDKERGKRYSEAERMMRKMDFTKKQQGENPVASLYKGKSTSQS